MEAATQEAPAPEGGLSAVKKRALSGTAVSAASKMAEQILRFGSNLILAKVLFPAAFGLMGLVYTLLMGIEMLSDLGVRYSVITNRREDDAFLDTAFTLNLVRGLALFLIALVLAWPFSLLYREPALQLLVSVSAISALFQGATSTKLFVANRNMQVVRLNAVLFGSNVTGLAVTVTLAVIMRSTWALVWGALVSAAIQCVLSHVAFPGRNNRLRWEPEAARDILNLGGWVFVSTMLMFFAMKIDILLLGTLVDKSDLGIYNMATNLSSLPSIVGGQIIGHILLPMLSTAYRESHATLVSTFERARRQILLAGGFICLGVALGSTPLFLYLFDARYHDAAWMTPLMMLSAWLVFLQEASSRALAAMGNVRPLAMGNLAKLIFMVIGCLVGRALAGTAGFILGGAAGALAGQVVIMVALKRANLPAGRTDLLYTAAFVGIGIVGLALPIWLERLTGVSRRPLSVLAAVVVLVPTGLYIGRRLLRAGRSMSG